MSLFQSNTRIPAVVINLDRHKDRLDWFMENATRVGLSVSRLTAFDAAAASNEQTMSNFRNGDNTLSNGEVACFLSHRMAWQMLLNSGADYMAIFEDDAHLSEDLAQLLVAGLLPRDVHLLRIEEPCGKASITRSAIHHISGRRIHRILTRAYGTAGYIISRTCAADLLERTKTGSQPVDVFLFDDRSEVFSTYSIYQIVPAACVQDMNLHRGNAEEVTFASEIEKGRNEVKDARKVRDRTGKKTERFKKLRRYLRCVIHGADPLRYRDYIPVDLGSPKTKDSK